MRIAYIGHSYHRKTGSSAFFLDELRSRVAARIESFWYDGWLTGKPFDVTPIVEGRFDAVIVWQVESVAHQLAASELPNVTFFPMFDSCWALPDSYWRALSRMKVVCFSSTLHERLQRLALCSRFARYYPDPEAFPRRVGGDPDPAGYFWQRQQEVTWNTIRPLLGDTRFGRFTLHAVIDPSFGSFVPPPEEDVRRHGIRVTEWFPSREEALDDVLRHDVYFAARPREGIGMSFLEAMAMGFLVVAADRPTMNEYIVSGVNGLLYDPATPQPLDFSRRNEMGERARRSVEAGRRKWLRCVDPLLEFVLSPSASHPLRASFDAFDPLALECEMRTLRPRRAVPAAPLDAAARSRQPPAARRTEGGRRLLSGPRADGVEPLVTVAVVTLEAEKTLAGTLESILAQDHPRLELLVLDGASGDGTLEIVRRYEDVIDYWRSEKDRGPYDAMNAAAALARGRFIIFMNAGDRFQTTDALRLALDGAPADADVIFGHHVYREVTGYEDLHQAAHFEETWSKLRSGDVGWRWLSRVPCHQATLTRTAALRENPYRLDLRIAADHELLYRLARKGARFHHSTSVVATYVGGGMSWLNQKRCFEEWRRVAVEYTAEAEAVGRRFDGMRAGSEQAELSQLPLRQLLPRIGKVPGATRELKRRVRTRIAAALDGRSRLERTLVLRLGSSELDGEISFQGLSSAESWGRWTVGGRAVIELNGAMAKASMLALDIRDAYGPNVGKPLVVKIGKRSYTHVLRRGEQRVWAALDENDRKNVHAIELEIPAPASPRAEGQGDDPRMLGVALSSLELLAPRR